VGSEKAGQIRYPFAKAIAAESRGIEKWHRLQAISSLLTAPVSKPNLYHREMIDIFLFIFMVIR
jgi:hypothetical protein